MADTTDQVIRLTRADLEKTNFRAGQYYFTTDARIMFYDSEVSNSRTIIKNLVLIPTEKQRIYDETYSKVYGTLYYVFESSNLYIWNNKWEIVKGNQDYPVAYQYIDGDIYAADDMSRDVKGNGLLGDGSVVVRDVNRVIKAQIYIDETNDNLVISSFLGGGIKLLPNGNMEKTGALYLNPTTVGTSTDGLGEHYNEFNNINGEMYVKYEPDLYEEDKIINRYWNDSHKYLVWHEGNLDATGIINDWYVKKNLDKSDEGKGKSYINNDPDENGVVIRSENPDLDTKSEIKTHNYNGDGSPVASEFKAEKLDDPNENVGLYIVNNNGNLEIHLRKDKDYPTSADALDDRDQLLTKGEIVDILNRDIYTATLYKTYSDRQIYTITDQNIVKNLKEGYKLHVMFSQDSVTESIYIQLSNENLYLVDLNDTPTFKDRVIGFKRGSVYELIFTQSKWLVLNPQEKATLDDNGYGIVRVTGKSADVSSYTPISNSVVDLDELDYTYDGRYSFIGEISEAYNFPNEETNYITTKGMQYVLDTRSSQGRGTSNNKNNNSVEQLLTNVNTGKRYLRYLNRDQFLFEEYERGTLDENGRSKSDQLMVRQKGRTKVTPGLSYRFRYSNLTNIVQVSFMKLNANGTATQTSWMNVSANGVSVTMDATTKYIRAIYRYQDGTTQLNPSLISSAKIQMVACGYSEWQKIYDEDKRTSREKVKYQIISLPKDSWKTHVNGFYQEFYSWEVNENTFVEGSMDVANQLKLEASYIESFNFGYRIIALAKPTEDITMTVKFIEGEVA